MVPLTGPSRMVTTPRDSAVELILVMLILQLLLLLLLLLPLLAMVAVLHAEVDSFSIAGAGGEEGT